MKDLEILADMCLEVKKLLDRLYEKGIITKETYDDHTRVKLHFLQSVNELEQGDEHNL